MHTIKEIREKIRSLKYVVSLHAEEEMECDGLTVFDVEHGVLTGVIVERQKDRNTEEWKYRICGKTVMGEKIETVVKFGATGKLYIITVYAA